MKKTNGRGKERGDIKKNKGKTVRSHISKKGNNVSIPGKLNRSNTTWISLWRRKSVGHGRRGVCWPGIYCVF